MVRDPSKLELPAPVYETVAASYAAVDRLLDVARRTEDWVQAFARWDKIRRSWNTWANLTTLHYQQDTQSPAFASDQQALDALSPRITSLETSMKRRFLGSVKRRELEARFGTHVFALWEADVAAFDPALCDDLIKESDLMRQYTELLASATASFQGQTLNLSGIVGYLQNPDRETRHAAETARWSIFAERAAQLDSIFDALVKLRDGMGRKLGFPNFLGLGYRLMHRIDYGPDDVARYREEVRTHIVPLAADFVKRFGTELGFDRVCFWDEGVLGARDAAVPQGDAPWIVRTSGAALNALTPELGTFAREMLERNLLDVEGRAGKARGGFCTSFPDYHVPYVFANFNGTHTDVTTLVHELGHAFQQWRNRDRTVSDYCDATLETAEIHSTSLEYLAWPEMARFFGDGAAAFRQDHLLDALLFMPYGVAVDHFQHLVYERPEATPAERNAMWQQMEQMYLPWRDYGDLAYPKCGGVWQEKQHIYIAPLYYIDYTLARCCALQFWRRAQSDPRGALEAYVKLCDRGGEAAFGDLIASAGLASPFTPGVLADVAEAVRRALARP